MRILQKLAELNLSNYFTSVLVFGFTDLSQQFRRSRIGNLWIIINNIIYITALGFVWTYVFSLRPAEYFPYFSLSYLIWLFFSSVVSDSSILNISYSSVIKNIYIHKMFLIDRMVMKHFFNFLFCLPVTIFVFIIFDYEVTILGVCLFLISLAIFSLLLREIAVLFFYYCARNPDISKAIPSLLQVAFLTTPILWTIDLLQGREWIYVFNPIFYIVEFVRGPLTNVGHPFEMTIYAVAFLFLLRKINRSYFLSKLEKVALWS